MHKRLHISIDTFRLVRVHGAEQLLRKLDDFGFTVVVFDDVDEHTRGIFKFPHGTSAAIDLSVWCPLTLEVLKKSSDLTGLEYDDFKSTGTGNCPKWMASRAEEAVVEITG